ncbi:MAG: Mg(2+)-transport-ATPase-associated protein MgtC [Fluviibacter phosphoraccumulans EoVTN8]
MSHLTHELLLSFWSPRAIEVNLILLMHLAGSMFLGMLVGYERSYHGRAAGMRTFSLVCMASTGIVAIFGYPELWFGGQNINSITADGPSRVIQGIVTGIGFLGAGVIIREGRSISGLSTAASIWTAAAIGVLISLGFYAAGIALAVLSAFSMSIVLQLERWLPHRKRYLFELSFNLHGHPNAETLTELAEANGFTVGMDTISISLGKITSSGPIQQPPVRASNPTWPT